MPDTDDTTWFPSKVDTWLAAVMGLAVLMSLGAAVGMVAAGLPIFAAISEVVFLVAIYFGLVFPMRYGISRDTLVVRHGMVRRQVRLADIRSVEPSRNPMGSPALSLDRLMIRTSAGLSGGTLISPADRSGFLALLASRAGLERTGETLVRRG